MRWCIADGHRDGKRGHHLYGRIQRVGATSTGLDHRRADAGSLGAAGAGGAAGLDGVAGTAQSVGLDRPRCAGACQTPRRVLNGGVFVLGGAIQARDRPRRGQRNGPGFAIGSFGVSLCRKREVACGVRAAYGAGSDWGEYRTVGSAFTACPWVRPVHSKRFFPAIASAVSHCASNRVMRRS